MTKFLLTIFLGMLLATLLGVGLVLAGAVQNLRTIPAWTVAGALIGLGHAIGHAAVETFARWSMEEQVASGKSEPGEKR